jgi:hypothetical protein
MKRILQGLVKNMEIELVPGTTRSWAAYRLKSRDVSVPDTERTGTCDAIQEDLFGGSFVKKPFRGGLSK